MIAPTRLPSTQGMLIGQRKGWTILRMRRVKPSRPGEMWNPNPIVIVGVTTGEKKNSQCIPPTSISYAPSSLGINLPFEFLVGKASQLT
jgi:hypothetical protein